MKQRTIYKTLAVAVIILFIGLGVQPVVAVTSNTSDRGDGPDLKILSIEISEQSYSHFNYITIKCRVKNIGSETDGEYRCSGKMWRRNIFGKEKEIGYTSVTSMGAPWKHNDTIARHFFHTRPMWYPFGIYRIRINFNTKGDTNETNDTFDRYFLIAMGDIYPKIIYE